MDDGTNTPHVKPGEQPAVIEAWAVRAALCAERKAWLTARVQSGVPLDGEECTKLAGMIDAETAAIRHASEVECAALESKTAALESKTAALKAELELVNARVNAEAEKRVAVAEVFRGIGGQGPHKPDPIH